MMARTTQADAPGAAPSPRRPGSAAPATPISDAADGAEAEALIERKDFKIRLADTDHGRSSASMLINKMYGWRGYGDAHEIKGGPDRITLTATDKQYLIGTITLGIDSDSGLLADETFKSAIDVCRRKGGKACELTKLAIDPSGASKLALASLFHILFIYARRLNACTDVFIEVNPRHRRFYESMLGFEQLGEDRNNPRVNAPASLLWISLDNVERQIIEHGGTSENGGRNRSLYPFFFSRTEEDGIYQRLVDIG
ncbi:MAG: N-acetyltransferase [Telluria sp.]